MIDKAGLGTAQDFETAPAPNHPKGYTVGRKWVTTAQTEQDTDNNQEDFEWQIPTPGTQNEKDTTAPQIAINSQPATLTNQAQATFTFSSPESGVTFLCRLDTADWQECASPKTSGDLTDGSHAFYLKANDPAGNVCEPLQYTWAVDTTIASPSISLADLDSTSTSYSNAATAQVVISNDQEAVAWFLSENSTKPSTNTPGWFNARPSQFNLSIGDGSKTVYLWTKDGADNISSLGNAGSIILDTIPPQTIIDQSPATTSDQTQAEFIFSSNENGASFFCKLDSGEWQGCASSTTFNNLAEGQHSLEVKATDLALNVDDSPAQYNWLIDTTPSLPWLKVYTNSTTSPTNLTFSAVQGAGNPPSQNLVIENSGEAEMAWHISSAANWVSFSTSSGILLPGASTTLEVSANSSILDVGNYQSTSTIEAEDATNSPQIIQIALTIEESPNEPPISAFSYSSSENLLVGDAIIFNASSSSDSDGNISAFIWDFGDGTATTTQLPLISHTFNTTGQFQVLLIVQDDKGATSSPTSATLTIEVRPESRLLITEVQIRDASSTDHDFIEIFNPNNQNIGISGFQLKKRNSNGGEGSVRLFPASSTIPALGYFLWANSDYTMPGLTPDATSTQTIASDNSIALFYSDHTTIIDQVAWGTSTNPFVEIAAFSQNPSATTSLNRQKDGSGNYIDNNNNATDFVLASPTPTNSQGQTAPSTSSGQATTTSTTTPATTTPATSTPATSTPTFDPSLSVISDLQAAPAANRGVVDLWWANNYEPKFLINYNNQTTVVEGTTTGSVFTTTVENLTGGQNATFTVQYINSAGATSGPSNIASATPLFAFQDNNDGTSTTGTISDLYSGLMWVKNGSGFAANNGQTLTWSKAKEFCEQLVMCNDSTFATTTDATSTPSAGSGQACADKGGIKYDDWRLPNFKELASIIKYQKNPAGGAMIDTNYFQNIVAGKYWSGSFQYLTYFDPFIEKWWVRSVDFSSGAVVVEDVRSNAQYIPLVYNYVLPVREDSTVIPASGFEETPAGCSAGYQTNSDGTFSDKCSGLVWSNTLSGGTVMWPRTIQNANDATTSGYSDWRLPNVRELLMIAKTLPQGSETLYWTATADYQTSGQRWFVDLGSLLNIGQAQTSAEDIGRYVKLVRDP